MSWLPWALRFTKALWSSTVTLVRTRYWLKGATRSGTQMPLVQAFEAVGTRSESATGSPRLSGQLPGFVFAVPRARRPPKTLVVGSWKDIQVGVFLEVIGLDSQASAAAEGKS